MLNVSDTDNTAIAWGLFDALRRGDIERVLGYCDPDVVFSSLLGQVEGGSYRGHEGIRRFFSDQRAAWERWEPFPREVEVTGDMALVTGRTDLRGKGSGAQVTVDWAYLMRLREGKVLWGTVHSDPAEARVEFESLTS